MIYSCAKSPGSHLAFRVAAEAGCRGSGLGQGAVTNDPGAGWVQGAQGRAREKDAAPTITPNPPESKEHYAGSGEEGGITDTTNI